MAIGLWAVSLENLEENYITGLELISNDESIPNGTMGYRNPNGKLITVDIESPNQLRGFRIFAAQE
ncbi:hypothetical protein N7540_008866 [Penicillium herquei]|nr:hypothetical protein N7540_008866 [Penicillium herquei]